MQPASKSDRRAMIAKIQIAKKALAMVDESYRAMLVRITGQNSSAKCSEAQLGAVLTEFKRLGFEVPKKISGKPFVRMIYAIWKDLKPYLDAPNDAALAAFVQRQTGIDKPEWLDGKQAGAVIEALKGWLGRERGKAGCAP